MRLVLSRGPFIVQGQPVLILQYEQNPEVDAVVHDEMDAGPVLANSVTVGKNEKQHDSSQYSPARKKPEQQ